MEYPEEVKSGFRYFQSRYNELQRCSTELESEGHHFLQIVKHLKKHAYKEMIPSEKTILKNLYHIFSEAKYLQENFLDHQFVYIDNLVLLGERIKYLRRLF